MITNELNEYDSVRKIATAKGIKVYDTALPMDWYEDVHKRLGVWPQSYGFVWCYDSATISGDPFPLTDEANLILWMDGHLRGYNYRHATDPADKR